MKLLFVDDNEINREIMQDMIEILFPDVELDTYENVKDILNQDIDSYDLILSDIDMPDINGFEFYDILKEEKSYEKPVIAVTALAITGDKDRMLLHGFDEYISKPIDMDELESILNKYIKD